MTVNKIPLVLSDTTGNPTQLQAGERLVTNNGTGLMVPVGTIIPYAGVLGLSPYGSLGDWLPCNGGSKLRADYPDLAAVLVYNIGSVVKNGSSLELQSVVYPFDVGDRVVFSSTGTLPTATSGLTAWTSYYVVSYNSGTGILVISTTRGGSANTITAAGSGTHTIYKCPFGVADATHFTLPDLRGRTIFGTDAVDTIPAGRLNNITGGLHGTLGASGGEESHTLAATESGIAQHTHTQNSHSHLAIGGRRILSVDAFPSSNGALIPVTGGSYFQTVSNATITDTVTPTNNNAGPTAAADAHNNLPPGLVLNFLIKS